MNASGVETSKQVDVPRVWDVSFIHITQSIGPWSGDCLDDEGALPRRGELVHPVSLLFSREY